MKIKLLGPVVLLAVMLAGCETIGVPEPEGFNDRVGYALGTHTAVLQTIASSVRVGQISSDEADDAVRIADQARDIIDAARRVRAAGDIDGANRQLSLAITVLQELQAHLRGGTQ